MALEARAIAWLLGNDGPLDFKKEELDVSVHTNMLINEKMSDQEKKAIRLAVKNIVSGDRKEVVEHVKKLSRIGMDGYKIEVLLIEMSQVPNFLRSKTAFHLAPQIDPKENGNLLMKKIKTIWRDLLLREILGFAEPVGPPRLQNRGWIYRGPDINQID